MLYIVVLLCTTIVVKPCYRCIVIDMYMMMYIANSNWISCTTVIAVLCYHCGCDVITTVVAGSRDVHMQ